MPYLVSPVHYMHVNPLLSLVIVTVTGSRKNSVKQVYGVVPKGLLTFLGSLYKEVAKTTPGIWSKIFLPSKNTVSST